MTLPDATIRLDSLFPAPASIALVTGPSGSGKTALCLRVIQAAWTAGLSVTGVVCPGKYDETGIRIGIDLLDPLTDKRWPLATAKASPAEAGSRWDFLPESLASGAALLAASGSCDLLVIDELGPLELLEGQGWVNALDVLHAQHYDRALVVVRPRLLDVLKARLAPLPMHVVRLPEQP